MTVRFLPGSKKQKTSLIAGFLKRFKVAHELVTIEHYVNDKNTVHLGTDPAVEVDGKLFVDPNEDALKKILRVK